MKKCPFCAEEIQDEAIYCRYCSRDLAPQPTQQKDTTSKPKRSVWATGAIWAVVITVLAMINDLMTVRINLVFHLIMGAIANFIGWWLIFTFLTWLWRKLRWTLIGILITVIVFVAILMVSNKFYPLTIDVPEIFGAASTPTSTRRPTNTLIPTHIPTRTPTSIFSDCILWSSVTYSDVNSILCVYGRIVEINKIGQFGQNIRFIEDKGTFSLWSTEYKFTDITTNMCVAAIGRIIKHYATGDYVANVQAWEYPIFMELGEIELYQYTRCP